MAVEAKQLFIKINDLQKKLPGSDGKLATDKGTDLMAKQEVDPIHPSDVEHLGTCAMHTSP